MKRLFLSFILTLCVIVFSITVATASPFITVACYSSSVGITGFQISFNSGTSWTAVSAVGTCGSVTPNTCASGGSTMCYDLASLSNGSYTVIMQAQNTWGWSSSSSPFAFVKGSVPAAPSTVQIIR